MTLKTTKWDVTEYLDNEEDIAEYLNAVIELDDPALLQAAIGDVAKAQGMTKIAKDAGLGRESLYKSLSAQGNPSFTTILKVLHALGTSYYTVDNDVLVILLIGSGKDDQSRGIAEARKLLALYRGE